MQDSGVFHQQQQMKPLQQRPQDPTPAMKKVTDEPLLCDDILSCILALDEVIAEFDDSHSLTTTTTTTNGTEPPGVGIAGCTTNTTTTTPPSFITTSSWSPTNSGPLTPTTQIRHNCLGLTAAPAVREDTHNHHHHHFGLEQAEEEEEEYNQNHYPFSSLALAAAQPQVFSSSHNNQKNNRSNSGGSSSVVTVLNSQEKLTSPTPFKPSHHQTAHKLKIMSFAEEPLLPSSEQDNNKRVSLNQMEQDLLALGAKNNNRRNNSKSNNSNGPKCKIPTLKSPTSPISIQNNSIIHTNGSHGSGGNGSSGGGGGGSFPKVKHRSSNPLLEYRSVKMQHFIFPDSPEQEELGLGVDEQEDDQVIEEENWNFPTGKNLPRSLARTRDTGGAAEEDNAQLKASNPRFKESTTATNKSDVIKTSRIPKLKLETTCTVYEDNLPPAAAQHPQISPKVKSPGSVSLDSPSSSTGGSNSGRQNNSSYNNSNIPVAKPRRNSANNPPHNPSRNDSSSSSPFSAIKVTSTKKSESSTSSSSSSTPPMVIDSVVNELPHKNQFVKHREAFTTKNNNNNSNNNNSNILMNNDYNSDIPSATTDPYRDHHHVSEADDGYLSLINKRDESSVVLWPEEMIENEVFSEDELKRLSYQSASGSGCGGYMDDNQEIFAVNNSYNEVGADKTDYFSDDSLESESIEPECPPNSGIENVRKTPTSISFFANVDYIRPAVAPVSKPRANSTKPSGIPKPCSFFVPMDDENPSNSPPIGSTTSAVAADSSIESRGSRKRGKKSPPNPTTSSRPASSVSMETKDEPTCDTPPFTSYIIIRDDTTSAHGTDSQPSSPATKTNTPAPPSTTKQLEITTVDIGSPVNDTTIEPPKLAAEKIQHFAQILAYEIERSGSEEAAAALNHKQPTVLVEDPKENYCEHKLVVVTSENLLSSQQRGEIEKGNNMSQQLSDGRKTPPENMTPTRTTVAEFLASNVPDEAAMQLTRHEERLSLLSSPPGEKIGVNTLVVEDLESTEEDVPKFVGKSNKLDTELEQVDRIIANINKENPDVVELSPGNSEQRGAEPATRPKSLDISAFSGNWQGKLDEDNASDDLSETPPAFIPEPPPTVLKLNSSSLQLEGLEEQKVKEEEENDAEEGELAATAPALSNETPAETVKVAAAAPSISHSRGSSDGLRQPATERKNSRSSEDIVQAVNRDPAPTVGRTRPGASTLPLNSRPPVDGKGSFRPLRSMISRFKKNKQKQSHLSLSDETAFTSSHQEYSTSQHQQDVNGENSSTLERSNRQGSTKQRRNSASSSGSKKTSLFARIFFRRNK